MPASALQSFRRSLRGQSFCPDEPGYDDARTIPNAMIDRRPAVIARCTGAADVIACVRLAREHDVVVSVRGGGHSVAGKAVCEGRLMVDMAAMKGIRVDPKRRTVRAETGLKLGEFDRETQAFGLATTQGVVPTVGMAGLTLGGGWGNLRAKYGLAIDNVISADVVTAEGHLLTASATENPDLFWGSARRRWQLWNCDLSRISPPRGQPSARRCRVLSGGKRERSHPLLARICGRQS
jgi:FAD/FMN-containing dehydrogenase